MVIRTNGGIISDQMLSGGFRFFKLSSAALGYFANTTSVNGGVVIPGAAAGGSSTSGSPTVLFQTIVGQDESDYVGNFVGGATHSLGDILTMSDGSLVLVDAPAGPATITGFTIIKASSTGFATLSTLTQVSSTGAGTAFTMTTTVDEESPFVRDFYVPAGAGVPNSVADRIFREISGKATIVIINQIDDNNIHFACDASGFGWDTNDDGDAAPEILAAIKIIGPTANGIIGSGAAASNDPPVPDLTQSGATPVDLDVGGVTLTESASFELT